MSSLKFIPLVTSDVESALSHELFCSDNLLFLESVAAHLEEEIDFCYIDPPYNTGGSFDTGFTYNDKFKQAGDKDNHSSWLAFMKPRLSGLLPLLKDTGVVAISIDDSEIHRLRILCDSIFGEENFIAQIVIDGGAMKNNARLVSVTHEYLLLYAKGLKALEASKIKWPSFKKSTVLSFPSRSSTHLLEKMLGRRSSFNNPKNLDFIKYLVAEMCPQKGTVLDYFAGSGTTGHAVADLNASGAKRRFILCTNNENNIYNEVTKPRLIASVTGKWGNGSVHKVLPSNLLENTAI